VSLSAKSGDSKSGDETRGETERFPYGKIAENVPFVLRFPIFLSVFHFCPRAIVIPRHGSIAKESEFRFYNDLLVSVRDKVAALKKQGKSLRE
jgi:hypothetical protein